MDKNKQDRIFKINKECTDDGQCEIISFEKLMSRQRNKTSSASEFPAIKFKSSPKTRFVLGAYQYKNLNVEMALMPLYDEQHDSVGLRFTVGDKCIDSHGVLQTNEETAILTNRQCDAIGLSVKLPSSFYDWLTQLEQTMTW